MTTEERWKPQQTMPETSLQIERPKMMLRDTDSVLTQESVGGHSAYKIPPGTTRQGQRNLNPRD